MWAGSITPALRTYISMHKSGIKKAAFAFVHGTPTHGHALEQLEQLTVKPVAVLSVRAQSVKNIGSELDQFVNKLPKLT